jgi:hypothetical protein
MKFEVELPDTTIKDLREALKWADVFDGDETPEQVVKEMFYLDTCDARGVVKVRKL